MSIQKKLKDTYSNRIKDLLEKYYKTLDPNKFADCRRELPLRIEHLIDTKIESYTYTPELYYEMKNGKQITFQVFDNQPKKGEAGDIFCAIFTKDVKFAYFIVKNETRLNKVNGLITIIESKLALHFKAQNLHYCLSDGILIKEEDVTEELFFKIINKQRKKDKW